MAITIDLPQQMAEEVRECATIRGTTLERMVFDYLKMELDRKKAAGDVYDYLMSQSGWLPNDYKFNRDEANAR